MDPIQAAAVDSARERILKAAARLYAARGYEGTTIREIAEKADVTKPLIYYHFASKEGLFASLLRGAMERCTTAAREVLEREKTATDRLRGLLDAQVALARQSPEIYGFVHEVMTMPGMLPLGFDYKSDGERFVDIFSGVIEEGIRTGEFRNVSTVASVVMPLATLGIYVAYVLSGDLPQIPDGFERELFDLTLHGVVEGGGCA